MKIKALQTFEQGLSKKLGGTFKLSKDAEVLATQKEDGSIEFELDERPRVVPKPIVEKLQALGCIELS